MPTFQIAQDFNAKFAPSYVPVFVIFGGTAGIGRAMVETFAKYTKGNAHIIIAGRNKTAAEEIIAKLPKPESEGAWKHEFVACDAFLMKNIFTLTTNLLSSLSRINYLIISIENFDFSPRIETEEGIDKRLAARYYSRWRIIVNLLPLLKKAQEMGQDAKVMSILGAGKGPSVDFDDLEMKKNYGMLKAVKMSLTYNDLMVQELARREPDLSFVHIFPGAVKTRVFDFKHWAATLFWPIITPLIYLITVSPATCAEWMLYGLLSAEKGSNLLDNHGDSVGARKHPDLENAQLRLWEHTEELTKLKA